VVDVPHRIEDALSEIAGRIAVAELDRLEPARRGAGRNRGTSARAALEDDLDLDSGIASRVEDLPGGNVADPAPRRQRTSFARSK
jgi:hypothetical protein